MEFTFGIITVKGSARLPSGQIRKDALNIHLPELLDSIIALNIPQNKFEIVIVGGDEPIALWDSYEKFRDLIVWVPFDESIRHGWISKKKNLITSNSRFENIVFLNDYYKFHPKWYEGFLKFGNNWDVCMNIKVSQEGVRFRDWIAWDDPVLCFHQNLRIGYAPWKQSSLGKNHRVVNVPYSYDQHEFLYISGGYWVAKKELMETFPLDENFGWGQSEDVEWSKRWLSLKKYKYKMNTLSAVYLLKSKRLSCGYSLDGHSLDSGDQLLGSKSGIPAIWKDTGWENKYINQGDE